MASSYRQDMRRAWGRIAGIGNRITLRQLLTHTSGLFDTNDAATDLARVLARVKDPVGSRCCC